MSAVVQDNRVFKLTNFVPIGFKVPFYPIDMCLICRGQLTEVCTQCSEKETEECPITLVEQTHYHRHCHQFMSAENSGHGGAKKKGW